MKWELDPESRIGLAEQIVMVVRRAVIGGELCAGDLLPASRDLAEVLGVNSNTVLTAYRQLRDEHLLEFRRGRGVRVCEAGGSEMRVIEAAREYLRVGSSLGYSEERLLRLVSEAVSRS